METAGLVGGLAGEVTRGQHCLTGRSAEQTSGAPAGQLAGKAVLSSHFLST